MDDFFIPYDGIEIESTSNGDRKPEMMYLFGVLFGTFWGTESKVNICNLLIYRKYIDFMSFGWGTRIRTLTGRVRVCRPTVSRSPNWVRGVN
jgi:hypothetical protein